MGCFTSNQSHSPHKVVAIHDLEEGEKREWRGSSLKQEEWKMGDGTYCNPCRGHGLRREEKVNQDMGNHEDGGDSLICHCVVELGPRNDNY
jgi:hypothetical protein